MNRLLLPFLLLAACESGKIGIGDDTGGPNPDTDADTDADSDTDTDADTDTDTDTDTTPSFPDIVVDCKGGGDYMVIQDAIDAAVSGDRIGVEPCDYDERLDFLGKTIEVYGIEGSAVTFLDANSDGTAVNIETGEGVGTRFAGFTIEEGYDEYEGAVIEVGSANAEFEDLVITESQGRSMVYIVSGWVDMKDVTITGNVSMDTAIYVDSGSLTAEGLDIDCEDGDEGIWHHVALNLDDSRIVCDNGYAINNYHGTSIIQRSYLYGGIDGLYSADEEGTKKDPDDPSEENFIYNSVLGGGSHGANMLYQYVIIENSVLWGGDAALSMTACNVSSYAMNSVFTDSACGIESDQAFSHTFSAFYGNTADGCGLTVTPAVSSDPMFTDFPDDLTLRASSPLIDAGNPAAAYYDADGSRNDIGRYGGMFGG